MNPMTLEPIESEILRLNYELAKTRNDLAAAISERDMFRQRCIGYEFRLGLFQIVGDVIPVEPTA